ncbi:MAG: hypothetical protein IPK17_35210 [Chloroflexi bacterium]|uniref:hypothetical protein n=1 Tax=Candidatus Flexifilum breve TaxID=3140694 RepID=UPI003134C3D5|nr:hypothetical protein [Chloroflexota bacterium]
MSDVPPPKLTLWKRVAQFFSDNVAFLLQLTSLFAVAGFFVIHTYLETVTGLFTYEVNPVVYIAAGVNMLGGTFLWVIANIVQNGAPGFLLGLVLIVVLIIVGFIVRGEKAQRWFDRVLVFAEKWSRRLTYFGLIVVACLSGIAYGVPIYGISPRSVGGGAPASVILVFKPTEDFYALGLPLSMDATHTLRSQPVELLMELRNSLLVRDPQFSIPFVVRDDLLFSVIDASRYTMPILPLPPTPTPTVATTVTP